MVNYHLNQSRGKATDTASASPFEAPIEALPRDD
jgi:hypothetical protein